MIICQRAYLLMKGDRVTTGSYKKLLVINITIFHQITCQSQSVNREDTYNAMIDNIYIYIYIYQNKTHIFFFITYIIIKQVKINKK